MASVYFQDEIPEGKTFPLDLGALPQGLYFLKMNLGGHVVVEKVVVGPR